MFSYNEECTKFDGKICLQTGSSPYDITCTGNKYINVNAAPENSTRSSRSCILAIWGKFDMEWADAFDAFGDWRWYDGEDDCYAKDFMVERSFCIDDDDLCAVPTTYTLQKCLNRFGLGYFEEDPSTGKFKTDYSESCVGWKTQDINGTSPYAWEYTFERYLPVQAQQVLNLPEGACVQGEASQIYSIPTDAANCNGSLPCSEFRRYTCNVDLTPSTGEDPNCALRFEESLGGRFPSLLQQNLFCSADELSVNLRRNGFCTMTIEPFRISPPNVGFCSHNDDQPFFRVEDSIPRIRFCETNITPFRIFVQNVGFCSLDTSFIRPPVDIPSAYFCSHDPTSIRLQPQSAPFCSIAGVISKVQFCESNDILLRPADPVGFCEHVEPLALTFAPQLRSAIAPENNVGFCSMTLDAVNADSGAITQVGFCGQKIATAVTFCSYPRKLIDAAENIAFCEYPRKLIDNITDLTFCETPRKLIAGTGNTTFCSQDDTMI